MIESTLSTPWPDYPGEWLTDLSLLDVSFDQWSKQMFMQAEREGMATLSSDWRQSMEKYSAAEGYNNETLRQLHNGFRQYLLAAKAKGVELLQPGRFILPGSLQLGAPMLTFCPCHKPDDVPETELGEHSLYQQMERRFEMYKNDVVKHFL